MSRLRATIARPSPALADPAAHDAWRNAAIAFAVMVQVLFVGTTTTLGVLAMILTLAAVAIFAWRSLVSHLISRPLPHIFWILALLSTLWSIEPALTARFAIQLALTTFLGMLITGFGDGRGALQGAAAAFPLFLAVSVLSGHSVAMGNNGDTAFAGLTGSKNLLAGSALVGFFTVCAAAYDSFERRMIGMGFFFVASTALALYVMGLARSSGAVMGFAVISPLMLAMLALRGASTPTRSVLLIAFLITSVTTLIFIEPLTALVTDIVLTTFNKDPTLTGRVYLWQRADEIIQQRPWLGLGYNAFWVQGHVDAEGLWRWAGIAGRRGFNFHNTMRETLVAFGWIGFSILSAAIAIGYALFARLFVLGATTLQILWLAVLTNLMMSVGWEAFLPMPFSFSSFLIFAALSAACSPVQEKSVASPNRRRVSVRAIPRATSGSIA